MLSHIEALAGQWTCSILAPFRHVYYNYACRRVATASIQVSKVVFSMASKGYWNGSLVEMYEYIATIPTFVRMTSILDSGIISIYVLLSSTCSFCVCPPFPLSLATLCGHCMVNWFSYLLIRSQYMHYLQCRHRTTPRDCHSRSITGAAHNISVIASSTDISTPASLKDGRIQMT